MGPYWGAKAELSPVATDAFLGTARMFAQRPLQLHFSCLTPQEELKILCFISLLLTSYPASGQRRLDHVLANHSGCRDLKVCIYRGMR